MVHSPDPIRSIVSAPSRRSGEIACRNAEVPTKYDFGFPPPVWPAWDRELRAKAVRPEGSEPIRLDGIDLKTAEHSSPGAVTVVSRGATLIVGRDAAAVYACAERLAPWLDCLPIVLAHEAAMPSVETRGSYRGLICRRVTIGGHFGAFRARVIGSGGWADVDRYIQSPRQFDLVLDLTSDRVFQGERIPAGYFAVGDDEQALAQALLDLPDRVGTFAKARVIEQDPALCGHSHAGLAGCRQCLRVCPCGAVTAHDQAPRIDPLACDGCAACASACPAGRLRFDPLPHEDLLTAIRLTLESQSRPGVTPVLALFQGAPGSTLPVKINSPGNVAVVSLNVPEIGCIGLEVLLTALAYGAGGILVLTPPKTPRRLYNNLKAQIHWARLILSGLGRSLQSIRLLAEPCPTCDLSDLWPAVVDSNRPAGFSPFHNKRTLVRLAAESLVLQSGVEPYAVALPADAPFGAVGVDPQRCSLCRACVDVCAHQALQWDRELEGLKFVESRCTQCGLCVKLCPEAAIEVTPRFLYDRRISEMAVMLNIRETA